MTDTEMTTGATDNASIAVQVDSLSASEFAVEIDGERAPGIFRVSGLIPFKLDIKPQMTKVMRDPFKIAKMVQRDPELPFNRWLRETSTARDDFMRPTRTLAVVALDDGVETRRWLIKGAYIAEVAYSDFNSASSELLEEILTIYYEDVEVKWYEQADGAAAEIPARVESEMLPGVNV